MYGDVNVAVDDGSSESFTTGTGVQVKIGISDKVSKTPILIKSSMKTEKVKELLGETPLADACIEAMEWGAEEIYCIPVKAAITGKIGQMEHTGTGGGTVSFSGNPNNVYDVIIEILETGNTNEGTMRHSLDGGETFSQEMTIPLSGELELPNTGIKVQMADAGEGNSFIAGDTYQVKTTAPAMSNEQVLSAAESLANSNIAFEMIHIVGESGRALWSAIGSLADRFLSEYKKPVLFICEARSQADGEKTSEYFSAMEAEQKGIKSIFLQVVCCQIRYMCKDGRIKDINPASIVTGLYCQAKESQSIGEVKSFKLSDSKVLKLLPEGIEDMVAELDSLGYLTLRQYMGKQEYYVTSTPVFSEAGSKYRYAEDVRVLIRLIKEVRNKALEELNVEVDTENMDADIAVIEEELNIPIEDAITDGIISSGSAKIITDGINIHEDEYLNVQVSYVPKGHIREYNITFSVENPYSEG